MGSVQCFARQTLPPVAVATSIYNWIKHPDDTNRGATQYIINSVHVVWFGLPKTRLQKGCDKTSIIRRRSAYDLDGWGW